MRARGQRPRRDRATAAPTPRPSCRTMEILRKYVMGYNPVCVQVISEQSVHFGTQEFNRVNWEGASRRVRRDRWVETAAGGISQVGGDASLGWYRWATVRLLPRCACRACVCRRTRCPLQCIHSNVRTHDPDKFPHSHCSSRRRPALQRRLARVHDPRQPRRPFVGARRSDPLRLRPAVGRKPRQLLRPLRQRGDADAVADSVDEGPHAGV